MQSRVPASLPPYRTVAQESGPQVVYGERWTVHGSLTHLAILEFVRPDLTTRPVVRYERRKPSTATSTKTGRFFAAIATTNRKRDPLRWFARGRERKGAETKEDPFQVSDVSGTQTFSLFGAITWHFSSLFRTRRVSSPTPLWGFGRAIDPRHVAVGCHNSHKLRFADPPPLPGLLFSAAAPGIVDEELPLG
ncbi:hypothetical protein CPLU01_04330 [Colletotrichum plurivorum]|uniref:Uncharacterized protein n=1 Tax=Colletotrichum plurivorum TaxID=2175906 RepID=A0A8H6NJA5_9PEZI|nr:hypothetical protein CPLU01_04330 [Colletotrichum plurivorum]